jgi:hypothetical protein
MDYSKNESLKSEMVSYRNLKN